MSLAFLVDSTTALASPALSWRLVSGSSTNTMSLSSCCAKSLMPMVATPSATRTHSWDLAYLRSEGMLDINFEGLNYLAFKQLSYKAVWERPPREPVCREFQFQWVSGLWQI